MRLGVLLPLLIAMAGAQADERLKAILGRVSEEAEAFAMAAPKIVGQETLRQKARRPKPRFRLRIGRSALAPAPVRYQTREIISEYGYTSFQEAPGSLHELRQVVSVDGRLVADEKKARETLTLGITGEDDRLKKKMLRQFENHGLVGAATDFGQLILLFRGRRIADYEFQIAREGRIGADKALILSYRQLRGPESLTIFEGRGATKARLEGELWVRESDSIPLRIALNTVLDDGKHVTAHHGTVDYFRSSRGLMLPASVRYVKLVDDELMVENVHTYSSFRMFSVQAEIKFTPEETAPR